MQNLVRLLVDWFSTADKSAQATAAGVVVTLGLAVLALPGNLFRGVRWVWRKWERRGDRFWLEGRFGYASTFEGLDRNRWKDGHTINVVGFNLVNYTDAEVTVLRVGLARGRSKAAERFLLDPRDESSEILFGDGRTTLKPDGEKELRFRDDECVKAGAPEDVPLYPFALLPRGRIVFAKKPIVLVSWERQWAGGNPPDRKSVVNEISLAVRL